MIALILRTLSNFKTTGFSNVKFLFSKLLESGYDGAYLTIYNRENPDVRLRFRKYVLAEGEYGAELCFPNMSQALDLVQEYRKYCEKEDILLKEKDFYSDSFLCADFGKNVDKAHKHFTAIVEQVIRVPISGQYRYAFRQMAQEGTVIDSPNLISEEKHDRLEDQRFFDLTGSSRLFFVFLAVIFCMSLLGTLGLVYSLIFQYGHESILSFQLRGTTIKPKIFDVTCITLIFLEYWAMTKKAYWFLFRSKEAREKNEDVQLPRGWNLLARLSRRPVFWAQLVLAVLVIRSWITI